MYFGLSFTSFGETQLALQAVQVNIFKHSFFLAIDQKNHHKNDKDNGKCNPSPV